MVDGVRWHYQRAGEGSALMLVHGLMGHSFSWRYALPVLAQHAAVYAVDLPGTGYSARAAGLDYSLRASASRLLQFMDINGVDSFDLLGTSHGGAVAMMAAALAPKRVRRLVLVAPVNPWSERGKLLSVFLSSPPIAPLFLATAPRLKLVQEFYFRRLYGDTRRIRRGTFDGYMAPMRAPGSFEYPLGVLRSWNRDLDELEAMLPSLANIPAMLMWGTLDAAVDPASARPLGKYFENCRCLMLDGVGHLPYEEVPAEFNRAIVEYLFHPGAIDPMISE
jgi:pimeloyl-ACP methyl ester carboxylesterase